MGLLLRRRHENGVDARLNIYPGVPHEHSNIWLNLGWSFKFEVDAIWNSGWRLD
jgi:hypothetical protein